MSIYFHQKRIQVEVNIPEYFVVRSREFGVVEPEILKTSACCSCLAKLRCTAWDRVEADVEADELSSNLLPHLMRSCCDRTTNADRYTFGNLPDALLALFFLTMKNDWNSLLYPLIDSVSFER